MENVEATYVVDESVAQPETTVSPVRYAGFWIRFGAYIIDSIVLSIVMVVLNLVIVGTAVALGDSDAAAGMAGVISTLLSLVISICYFPGMEGSSHQATLGKKALGLKVVNEEGARISVGQAIGRYFGKIISGLILCIGYMMAGWTEKKQALHDKMASTYVVKAD